MQLSHIFSRPQLVVLPLALVLFAGGCGKEEAKQAKTAPAAQTAENSGSPAAPPANKVLPAPVKGDEPLPPNHPPLGAVTGNSSQTLDNGAAAAHPKLDGKKALAVVVPDSIKGHWKAVNLVITGPDGKEKAVRAAVGDKIDIGTEGAQMHVMNFLPAYTSDFNTATSSSNEPTNPAVQVQLIKQGKVLAEGWVFQKLPDFNSFSSGLVKVKLVSAEPAK
ncbi:MAG: hypothetical protein ACYC05_13150 [Sulfuricella sp.]|nr:hypothetical protein [Gammaproteobacteria bacterium]